jgi:hypothetical protein
MTPLHSHQKSAEEIRLSRKYRELARLRADLLQHQRAYISLGSELRIFEQEYEEIIGVRITVLRDLEWQLQGLVSEEPESVNFVSREQEQFFSHGQNTTTLLDKEEFMTDGLATNLKALYREVAKAFHPDLATTDEERRQRQELMTLANDAYRVGDGSLLTDLLHERKHSFFAGSGLKTGMEVMVLNRRIAAVRQDIRRSISKLAELKLTDIYLLKLRVDAGLADGFDLLSEMAARTDDKIEQVRRRLFLLRGGVPTPAVRRGSTGTRRTIRFPSDLTCGMLYVRNAASVDYRDWQRVGVARGTRDFSDDMSVRLDVKGGEISDCSFLGQLQSHDLQSLFFYNGNNCMLAEVPHLTGLQELYLSDTQVSDQILKLLKPLQSLKRITLFRTTVGDEGLFSLTQISGLQWLTCSGTFITEEGLNQFRKVMPGCKAVSFAWRNVRTT